jgi:WD40 repeat protein
MLFSGSEDATVRVWEVIPAVAGATAAAISATALTWPVGSPQTPAAYNTSVVSAQSVSPTIVHGDRAAKDSTLQVEPSEACAYGGILATRSSGDTSVHGSPGSDGSGVTASRTFSSRAPLRVLEGHTGTVTALTLDAHGPSASGLLLSASLDGSVRLWDYASGLTVARFTHHEEMRCVHNRTCLSAKLACTGTFLSGPDPAVPACHLAAVKMLGVCHGSLLPKQTCI